MWKIRQKHIIYLECWLLCSWDLELSSVHLTDFRTFQQIDNQQIHPVLPIGCSGAGQNCSLSTFPRQPPEQRAVHRSLPPAMEHTRHRDGRDATLPQHSMASGNASAGASHLQLVQLPMATREHTARLCKGTDTICQTFPFRSCLVFSRRNFSYKNPRPTLWDPIITLKRHKHSNK